MEKEYFVNSNLKSLKCILLAFATFPVVVLIGVIFSNNANSELIKIFSYISAGVAVLCAFIFLWFSTLPTYYFYIENNILCVPNTSFAKWSGEYFEFELTQIQSVNIDRSYGDGYDLNISVNSKNKVKSSTMALGHISIESENKNSIIHIHNLKKKHAIKLANKLNHHQIA